MNVPILAFISFLLLSTAVNAQFGFNLGYKFSDARTWQIATDNYITNGKANMLKLGTTGGLDYNFPTKSKFLALQPNIQFTRLTSSLIHYQTLDGYNFELFNFSFQLNMNFYLLEFKHKKASNGEQQNMFTNRKGIFIQLSPAFDHFRTKLTHPEVTETGETTGRVITNSAVDFSYSIGLRTGFDLEWTPNFKLTPLFGLRYFPRVDWKDLTEISSKGTETASYDFSSILQYSIGLRVGFDLQKD